MQFTTEQTNAIDLCADTSKKIVCVTGGAGTGKTTILKEAIKRVLEENPNIKMDDILLSAPTGRAASVIQEATGFQAYTIHKAMRFTKPETEEEQGLPKHNKQNPLKFKMVFIDEASMLTKQLRRQVIDAMRLGSCIRFFGDVNQLPPINSASPFALDLEKYPSITLSENFRSTDGIVDASIKVTKNLVPISSDQVKIYRVERSRGMDTMLELAEQIDFTLPENQIICPTNVGKVGAEQINLQIQQKFNPEKEKIRVHWTDPWTKKIHIKNFKRGDKILWNENDYNLNLMNGMIGTVTDFNLETGEISLFINEQDKVIPPQIETYNDSKQERYTYDPRKSLSLAYAISTHKSQGSQFDYVCYVIAFSRSATRQNVYTALTRAKNTMSILNVGGYLGKAINNVVDIRKDPKR